MDRIAMQSLHDMLAPARTAEVARESFWDDVTMYLEAEVRPALRGVYESRVRPRLAQALGREPDRHEIAEAMRGEDENRFWYRLRTDSQREGSASSRMVIDRQLDTLMDRARARGNGPGSIRTCHCHPISRATSTWPPAAITPRSARTI
jgi:hypothetical protein